MQTFQYLCGLRGNSELSNVAIIRTFVHLNVDSYLVANPCSVPMSRGMGRPSTAEIALRGFSFDTMTPEERKKESTARWQAANRDRIRAKQRERHSRLSPEQKARLAEKRREYYQRNKAARNEASRQWSEANRDKRHELNQRWYRCNPGISSVYHHNRRARIAKVGGVITRADIQRKFKSQQGVCWWCGKKIKGTPHADHLIPIAKGGSNGPENIVIACAKCNLSKNDKMPSDWCGRLL